MDNVWKYRFMSLAKQVSTWSKDPSTQIGSVAVSKTKQILSVGYNGFPNKIADDDRYLDREAKLKHVIHSEMNLLLNALKNGVCLDESILFVYNLPICSNCAKHIIQAGISEVFVAYPPDKIERWKDEWEFSKNLFNEAKITIEELDWSKV